MGRQLHGSIRTRGDRFLASVPRSKGSSRRVESSFTSREDADAWREAQIRRIEAGKSAIRPADDLRRTVVASTIASSVTASLTFEQLADRWFHEHYILLEKGGADRAVGVEADLRNHLVPAFADLLELSPEQARRRAIDFTRCMSGRQPATPDSPLRPGNRTYMKKTVTQMLWVLREIVSYGHMLGVCPALPLAKVTALKAVDRPANRDVPLISLSDAAALASQLHVIHQVVLWLLRVAGLRISEAYGLRVGSLMLDDDGSGFLLVEGQAGRTFVYYDVDRSSVQRTRRRQSLKTDAGYRLIAIPAALTRMLVEVIEVYHTDTAGMIDMQASLIPPIQVDDGGIDGFRSALRGLGVQGVGDDAPAALVLPHDFRKALGTDLGWDDDVSELLRRRTLGHRAGADVTSLVYTLDSRLKEHLAPAAQALHDGLVKAGFHELIVPTTKKPYYGRHLYDAEARARIDARLAEIGWQVTIDADALGTAEAAATLGMSETATRRLYPDVIAAFQDRHGAWWAKRDDVIAYRERWEGFEMLDQIADRLGISYHQARNLALRLQLEPVLDERTRRTYYNAEQVAMMTVEHERIKALQRRSMLVRDAAAILETKHPAVHAWLKQGRLDADPERDGAGRLYITRASIKAELARRRPNRPPSVSVADFKACTGFDQAAVQALVKVGVLVRCGRNSLTSESVRDWMVAYRPDLLGAGLLNGGVTSGTAAGASAD